MRADCGGPQGAVITFWPLFLMVSGDTGLPWRSRRHDRVSDRALFCALASKACCLKSALLDALRLAELPFPLACMCLKSAHCRRGTRDVLSRITILGSEMRAEKCNMQKRALCLPWEKKAQGRVRKRMIGLLKMRRAWVCAVRSSQGSRDGKHLLLWGSRSALMAESQPVATQHIFKRSFLMYYHHS